MSIVHLKDLCWPYGIRSQLEWIKNNIYESDMHICVFCGDLLVGYCNLIVDVSLFDEIKLPFFGIGNLCVDPNYRKKGIGAFILKQCLNLSKNKNISCLLLCNNEQNYLFYLKNGCFSFDSSNPRIYIQNNYVNIHLLSLFFTKRQTSFKTIKFDRNF